MSNELTLARLRRCDRWVETGRKNGYVLLEGMRYQRKVSESLLESELLELLRDGLVKCEASERLAELPNRIDVRLTEIQQKYWSACK